jgi:secreted Zn-dependent insulinase-like peptidase
MGKGRGRPGGNPELEQHKFTTTRAEPLVAPLHLRITQSMKDELSKLPNPNDFVRDAISEKLASQK